MRLPPKSTTRSAHLQKQQEATMKLNYLVSQPEYLSLINIGEEKRLWTAKYKYIKGLLALKKMDSLLYPVFPSFIPLSYITPRLLSFPCPVPLSFSQNCTVFIIL